MSKSKGDYPDAIKEAGILALAFGERPEVVTKRTEALRQSYEHAGPRGYWLTQLEFLEAGWEKSSGDPYSFAPIYAHLGNSDQAFRWLHRAYESHSQAMTLSLLTEPAFKSIHSDPRFQDLLQRIGRTQ